LIEKHKLDFVIHSSWQLDKIEKYNLSNSRIWLKINTGMNRLGVNLDDFEELFKKVESLNAREIILMSHLSASSVKDDPHTLSQVKIFNNLVDGISCKKSLSNSGAVFNMPEAEHDIVRPGMAIYGGKYNEFGTKNVSSLTSQIISLLNIKAGERVGYDGTWQAKEDCIIGSIPIGYADGLPYFKKPITVSVNGKEFKTAGKLNMDLTLINLEQDSTIKIGDTVKLWDFDSDLSKVSEEFNTISYNLLTNISSRVTKNYLE
jgi:alanine racemase